MCGLSLTLGSGHTGARPVVYLTPHVAGGVQVLVTRPQGREERNNGAKIDGRTDGGSVDGWTDGWRKRRLAAKC